jgi:hypothetical protein
MIALSEVFTRQGTSAASPITADDEPLQFAVMHRLLNKVIDAAYDEELYESEQELKPRPAAIVAAVQALATLSDQDADTVEVEPFSGELGLVWKSGRSKRVKAMFGPEREFYSVYHERMLNGRVIERHLEPHPDHGYLRQRLDWLRT